MIEEHYKFNKNIKIKSKQKPKEPLRLVIQAEAGMLMGKTMIANCLGKLMGDEIIMLAQSI